MTSLSLTDPADGLPNPVVAPALCAVPGITHGFFTREGGVSQGLYRGLNVGLGSHDDPTLIAENRRRVAERLGTTVDQLATVHQVHSPDAVTLTAVFAPDERPKADAMVTNRPGIALGVLTADCGPVLFADPQARVIGAAHAGWKGAIGGVLEATIEAMERLGARRSAIIAVLGPSISQRNYEVGPEFVARFVAENDANAAYFVASNRSGHALFNLNAYTVDRLTRAGVSASWLDLCTYAEPDRFFSFRRTTHAGEPDYGRQISAIKLEEA